ncbi:uncharacterized protein [Gossypium hirsutum]|uniref:Nudix hydrolase domain-containing protein n=1 Tax=Gossypium hirsutum TaxID=3635 RepID=A0ABM2YHX5_GOSHI|nr:uncharacterized protein LOC121203763 [Gossypium hirsutum]
MVEDRDSRHEWRMKQESRLKLGDLMEGSLLQNSSRPPPSPLIFSGFDLYSVSNRVDTGTAPQIAEPGSRPPPLVFVGSDPYTVSDPVDTSTASQIAPSPDIRDWAQSKNLHCDGDRGNWCWAQVLREFNHVNPQTDEEGKVFLDTRHRTLPAGYLEIGEPTAEGAIRETWEEAGAEVEVISPFAQLDIPLIGQTYVIFLAKLKKPQFSPGPESSECYLFELDDILFDSLTFSSIFVTLNLVKKRMRKPIYVYYQLDNFYQNHQRY